MSLEVGISLQLGRLSIRPFAEYRNVDGDVSGMAATRLLKQQERYSNGLIWITISSVQHTCDYA